ncbi:MAG: hypothetical protein A2939_01310 [Parcubacteria group bacterium RIFCSPLOWO2_01_FULL_48_18]|nr:MAG: hypothetical protein A2939_01310 [Parcubacteria group bacterium RIFCSPLOWO2_01_FULL_48_18]OHB23864.1 MAG: hypothetical protein A3J67_03215 [Parcubacteria group bacterium RIFCSPHIGHO2_02_FULL_48_10b]
MDALEKIATSLRTAPDVLKRFTEILAHKSARPSVIEKILEENHALIQQRLSILGLRNEQPNPKFVFESLFAKLKTDDSKIFYILGEPRYLKMESYAKVFELSRDISGAKTGFFLKKERAVDFLKKEPPRITINSLGYGSVEEFLEGENIFEIYSALRFLENRDWLNKVFFKQYEALTPDDFEERAIETIVLSEKWSEPAQYFLRKKYMNVGHLKELGLIYVIPWTIDVPGESIRLFGLLSHYFHEIDFYASLFRKSAAQNRNKFSSDVISLLRGDVAARVPEGNYWLIIQRYLARDDENDWRLAYPHVNPEAIHWSKAQDDIASLGEKFNLPELMFWKNLDWVGNQFDKKSKFVSFNLMDTTTSILKEAEGITYTYHHGEALWNKIFREYLGPDMLEEYIKEHIIDGYFAVN